MQKTEVPQDKETLPYRDGKGGTFHIEVRLKDGRSGTICLDHQDTDVRYLWINIAGEKKRVAAKRLTLVGVQEQAGRCTLPGFLRAVEKIAGKTGYPLSQPRYLWVSCIFSCFFAVVLLIFVSPLIRGVRTVDKMCHTEPFFSFDEIY